jgi:hypothetical protein
MDGIGYGTVIQLAATPSALLEGIRPGPTSSRS